MDSNEEVFNDGVKGDVPVDKKGADFEITCPVCLKSLENLRSLNSHLDNDHGFGSSSDNGSHSRQNSITDPSKVRKITEAKHTKTTSASSVRSKQAIIQNHWKKPINGKANCHSCSKILTGYGDFINCRKCGELYCRKHCKNVIKLDKDAKYNSRDGKFYICCRECFTSKPGYYDKGSFIDLTEEFKRSRNSKIDDNMLTRLQYENRLVKLVNGAIMIFRKYKDTLLFTFKVRTEISRLEQSVTPWKDDNNVYNCYICLSPFGLTIRKHHCRLCGSIICDQEKTNCSNEIKLQTLLNTASDLNFQYVGEETEEIDYSVRTCSHCIKILFVPRMFKKSFEMAPISLIKLFEKLKDIEVVITSILPKFQEQYKAAEDSKNTNNINIKNTDIIRLSQIRNKLIRSFALYNDTTRQINLVKLNTPEEKRIQQSIKQVSSDFINKNILPLKTLPGLFNDNKTTTEEPPEIKTLAEVTFNNLSIKEVKNYRDELMVLKEQIFLVENMINTAKSQRHFEEVGVLNNNLEELKRREQHLQELLAENSFT